MPGPTFRAVIRAVAEDFGVSHHDILSHSRAPRYVTPRHVAMSLCRELPGASLPALGQAFCRDHTTVHHAVTSLAARMTPDIEARMDRIRERLEVRA